MLNQKPGARSCRASGRHRLPIHFGLESDRLEAIIAGPAVPEISGAAFAAFDPLRHRDRLAALCTGILPGQIRETGLTHGALPSCYCLLLFCFCLISVSKARCHLNANE